MDNYFIGGLEPTKDDRNEVLCVGGTDYLLIDKFKTMLRDSLIDWGTFLEVYNDNINYSNMYDQVVRLLNIKENENLRDMMVPLIEKIYKLPAAAHVSCMMKQFMVYEPMSIAIHELFTILKQHYEDIVKLFIDCRNDYIVKNKVKVKLNDWDRLINRWDRLNVEHKLESSSPVLLFLNPPNRLKSNIHYKIPQFVKETSVLKAAVKKFKYPGFCPRVPHKRLVMLLQFPINKFVDAIKKICPDKKLPDYGKIESLIVKTLSNKPAVPKITNEFKRETPPSNLIKLGKHKTTDPTPEINAARIALIKWYVDKIMELRKQLLPVGKQYEKYYINLAKIITQTTELIKKELIIEE